MTLLLITTFPHTFIASFVWQDPFIVHLVYSCFMFIVHYNFDLGSNLIPIYLLGLVRVFLGYFLHKCTTCAIFISRFKWGNRINLIFIVKLFVLFVVYCVYEAYGPTPWSLPLLFVAIVIVIILAWFTARNEKVLVVSTYNNICDHDGYPGYTEKNFTPHIKTPALWLFIAVLVISVLNLAWLLVLAGINWVTPLRVQCLVVFGTVVVLVACAVILNCNKQRKSHVHNCKIKRSGCKNPCGN